MFKDFGAKDELPALTQIVMAISRGFVGNILWVFLGTAGLVAALNYYYRTTAGKRRIHKLMLTLPVLGPVMRKIAVARFTRTLGTLLSSGVPILDALEIVAKTAGNMVVEEAIMYARIKISEGKNMAQPLHRDGRLPADGRADGRRRRADRRARHDAQQDRRLLRRRGRRRGRRR